MLSRWRWIQANPEKYVNLLRMKGYSDDDIQMLCDRKKPLDFETVEDYKECVDDIERMGKDICRRTKMKDIQFIQQGSSCLGFSTNPVKGRRFIPTHAYHSGSDTDFRFTATGIQDYIQKCAEEGKDVTTREGAEHILAPHKAVPLFPEIEKFSEKWAPRLRAKAKHVQFSTVVDPDHAFFRAKLWDLPQSHHLIYYGSTGTHMWDKAKEPRALGKMEKWGSGANVRRKSSGSVKRSTSGSFKAEDKDAGDETKSPTVTRTNSRTSNNSQEQIRRTPSGNSRGQVRKTNSRTSNTNSREQIRRTPSGSAKKATTDTDK